MKRGTRLTTTGLLCVLVSGAVMAADAAAATGDLTQKPGAAACWSAVGSCSPGTALAGARSVTVSPDGQSAYAASQASGAVAVFARAADGTLTQTGCVSETGAGPCVDGTALDAARSVTVSPDGKNAYVASGATGAVAVFDRGADGTLTQKPGAAACISDAGTAPCVDGSALGGAFEVTVSPDGRNAYVASLGSGAVAVFARAADGTLTQTGCVSDTGAGPCVDGTALDGALGVTVSPDGKNAYVASSGSNSVAVFARAADGALTQIGCVSDTGAGPCLDGTALELASSVTVSPDGKNAYVTSQVSSAVAVFARAADGTLIQTGCVSDTGAGPCVDGTALDSAASLSVSPDGRNAYVASSGSDAVAVFARAADGALTQTGCVSDTGAGPCVDGAALDLARWVTISPDGKNAYLASVISGAVAVFDREPPPPPPPPTPTPPPPPPPPTERNVTPPSIEFVTRVAGGSSYRCNPGSWEGLDIDVRLEFAWYRLGSITGSIGGVIRETPTVRVATTAHYLLPQADYGKKYYCEVVARGVSGRRMTAYSPTTLLTGREQTIGTLLPSFYGDFRIRGIDVFQVVQPTSLAPMFGFPNGAFENFCGGGTPTSYRRFLTGFGGCTLDGRDPARTTYAGVPFDQRKQTTAIVYVDMVNGPASDAAQRLDVTLSAHVNGRRLSGAITKQTSDRPVAPTAWVREVERGVHSLGVGFNVPAAWLEAAVLDDEPLDLEATVNLPVGAGSGALRECPLQVLPAGTNCASNNRFQLDSLPVFDDLPDLTVRSLPLVTSDQTLNPPEQVLKTAVKLFPGGERLTILPYQGSVNIDFVRTLRLADDQCEAHRSPAGTPEQNLRECLQAHVNLALDDWWLRDAQNRRGYDLLMGVHSYRIGEGGFEPGWKRPTTTVSTQGQIPTISVNDGTADRPLTAAAHEFGHALGLPHAHTTCPGKEVTQPGELWPTDNEGRLQGTGFDRRNRLGSFTWQVRTDGSTPVYDLMSYCGNESTSWLSARNWYHSFVVLRELDAARRTHRSFARAAQGAASAGQALALGVVGPAGARIERVIPADPENLAPTSDPRSPLRVRALDAAGKQLGEIAAEVQMLQDAPDTGTFAAAIPAGTAVVELLSGTTTMDRKVRSRPPTVRVRGRRLGGSAGRRLAVRWTARDPDGEPLRVTVEYGADGKTWRTVYQGPSRGRANIPARFLEAGSRARVRVTVDDGFAHARAVSAPFRVAGRPPAPRIVLPAAGDAPQTGRVLLQGDAIDERGRRLRGRALTWFAGRKRLGTGERLTATLPGGRVTVRLQARDSAGRVAVAARTLRVAPVALQVRTLRVPDRVHAHASTVPVDLSTTVPATARARGRSWTVDARTRILRIPLPARPRTGLVRVELTIAARGPRQPALHRTILTLRA